MNEEIISARPIVQGYLNLDPNRCVRVRSSNALSCITIKGKSSDDGLERYEFEKIITTNEASELLKLYGGDVISKIRYVIKAKSDYNLKWEVDVFDVFDDIDLVLAEIETRDVTETYEIPDWIGDEVTGDVDYYNLNIMKRIQDGLK